LLKAGQGQAAGAPKVLAMDFVSDCRELKFTIRLFQTINIYARQLMACRSTAISVAVHSTAQANTADEDVRMRGCIELLIDLECVPAHWL
jgi:hypothetical protein